MSLLLDTYSNDLGDLRCLQLHTSAKDPLMREHRPKCFPEARSDSMVLRNCNLLRITGHLPTISPFYAIFRIQAILAL
jgi:hypothetical protein